MYRKTSTVDFKCPRWFSPQIRRLVTRILDPNPRTRVNIAKIMENEWCKIGYQKIKPHKSLVSNPESDFQAVLDFPSSSSSSSIEEEIKESSMRVKPYAFNAFHLISLSSGFVLSGLFEKDKCRRKHARFTTRKPALTIVSKLEEIAEADRKFKVVKKVGLVRLEGSNIGRKGQLGIDAEIFEVTSNFHVVEVKKTSGDTFACIQFRDQNLKPSLKDIVWAWPGGEQ